MIQKATSLLKTILKEVSSCCLKDIVYDKVKRPLVLNTSKRVATMVVKNFIHFG